LADPKGTGNYMRTKKTKTGAVGVALAIALAACGGTGNGGGKGGESSTFNGAVGHIVAKSDNKGGTVKFVHSDELDSLDPGNNYYATAWNFERLYTRALLTFKPSPDKSGLEVTPDLAEGLGTPSNGGKTWTYKLKKGIKYE